MLKIITLATIIIIIFSVLIYIANISTIARTVARASRFISRLIDITTVVLVVISLLTLALLLLPSLLPLLLFPTAFLIAAISFSPFLYPLFYDTSFACTLPESSVHDAC